MFGQITLTKEQQHQLHKYLSSAIDEEPTECPQIFLNFSDEDDQKNGCGYAFKMMFPVILFNSEHSFKKLKD